MSLSEETKEANRLKDPGMTSHCGCGVPFTLDCPECKEHMGDEYNSPDEEPADAMVHLTVKLPKALSDRLLRCGAPLEPVVPIHGTDIREIYIAMAVRDFLDAEVVKQDERFEARLAKEKEQFEARRNARTVPKP